MNDPRQPAPPQGAPSPRPLTTPPPPLPPQARVAQPAHPPGQQPRVVPPPAPPRPVQNHNGPDLSPIAFDDDDAPAAAAAPAKPGAAPAVGIGDTSKIKMQVMGMGMGLHAHRTDFKRKTSATGHGACRVRTFHGRLSDEGMAYMDDKINEWLDGNPDVEVKFVTSTVGLYDGKIKEQALIVNVWY